MNRDLQPPGQFSIGQRVRIVDYDRRRCGEFGSVRSVMGKGGAAILILLDGTLASVTKHQAILCRAS